VKRWVVTIRTMVLAAFLAASALAAGAPGSAARAETNGAALKPQMGWSSWSFIRHNPTEADIEAQARAMHDSGLQAHGYHYVNVDDFWYKCPNTVDSFGRWAVDTSKFPNGISAVATYVHNLGLQFGIYVTPGIPFEAVTLNTPIQGTPYHARDIANTAVTEKNYNCHQMYAIDYSKPGSQEFINSWASEFASWGADYLKLDGVGTSDVPDLRAWSKALVASGRLIHLELSNNLAVSSATTWRQYSNGWRIEGDVECYCNSTGGSYPLTSWAKVARRFSDDPKWAQYGGTGGWNDLDSLELGNASNDGLTPDQRQAHMTLWAIAAAPLILGSDLTNLDPSDLALMTNDEVIAVDQAGIPGSPLTAGATQQVWRARQLDGSYYVALFNLDTASSSVSVTWSQLGFSGPATVRDLWSHTNLGSFASGFGATVAPTASRLLKVVPTNGLGGTAYEAESSANTLAGGARVQTCSACSGGAKVGYIGKGGTLRVNQVTAPAAGTYQLTVFYTDGDNGRSLSVSTNGGAATTYFFASTGSFSTVGVRQVPVSLNAGANTVLLANASAYGPDVDRIVGP
jgi:Alpha galactosidase A/Alpha galactosidase C-terminal beta sandwich domain/Carbohydrate binding module (family 35)